MRHVGERKLKCIGCGACESICPKNCIDVVEVGRKGLRAFVAEGECISCGQCLKVCPIEEIKIPDDLNRVKKGYRGHSNNKDIYLNSSSGGGVSSLLWTMFEKNLIDAALVAHYDDHLNIFGDFITSQDEILTYSGSFYQTCKQLVNFSKIGKFRSVAVVGLPCHISAVKKYVDKLNINNIYITISLFCTFGRMREGLKDFLKNRGMEVLLQSKTKHYKSRIGEKRDSQVLIEACDGSKIGFGFFEYLTFVDYFYTPQGCFDCRKLFGLHADISVGDDWGFPGDKKVFLMAVNTDKGLDLLSKSLDLLEVQDLGNDATQVLMRSQPMGFALKVVPPKWKRAALHIVKNAGRFNQLTLMRKLTYKFRSVMLEALQKSAKHRVNDNICSHVSSKSF